MTGLLASVANAAEARLALQIGFDIIDLKGPAAGALGALPATTLRAVVDETRGRRPVSATIGDLPMVPDVLVRAVRVVAATGVDYVKVGCFPCGDWHASFEALSPLTDGGIRLVAVLFGDDSPVLDWVTALARAGFTGVMLDTRDKSRGALTQLCAIDYLREFVDRARACGLLSGLAGSLRTADVAPLLSLRPDYLGFRGALCFRHQRTDGLDPDAARALRQLVPPIND